MGRRWGDRLWPSHSSQHLLSRPQLVCWRVAGGPPSWACRVQAYKLPNAGRVAVLMSLTSIIQNCDRLTASLLIRAILIRPSPITISDRCGLGRVTGAINKMPYTSARAKPRRRPKHRCQSSRSDCVLSLPQCHVGRHAPRLSYPAQLGPRRRRSARAFTAHCTQRLAALLAVNPTTSMRLPM
jgi:hypothetical protein